MLTFYTESYTYEKDNVRRKFLPKVFPRHLDFVAFHTPFSQI